jgi:hypothetical protein
VSAVWSPGPPRRPRRMIAAYGPDPLSRTNSQGR